MSSIRDRLESVAYVSMVSATVLIAAVLVRREFFPKANEPGKPVRVDNWAELAAGKNRIGPASAAVTIVEFADFQCPACRFYNLGMVRSLLERYPNDVALVYRQFPLDNHKYAYAAARASECISGQPSFDRLSTLFYQKQDSLGIKPFKQFAAEAGVADIAAFESCASHTGRVGAVDADIALAKKIGISGTPTFVINGFKQTRHDSTYIESLVLKELAKRK
jgi:protein-disulfide isomerase